MKNNPYTDAIGTIHATETFKNQVEEAMANVGGVRAGDRTKSIQNNDKNKGADVTKMITIRKMAWAIPIAAVLILTMTVVVLGATLLDRPSIPLPRLEISGVGFDPVYNQLPNYAGSYSLNFIEDKSGTPFDAGTINGWELYITTNYSLSGDINCQVEVDEVSYLLLGDYPANRQMVDVPVLEDTIYQLVARAYTNASNGKIYSEFSSALKIETLIPMQEEPNTAIFCCHV